MTHAIPIKAVAVGVIGLAGLVGVIVALAAGSDPSNAARTDAPSGTFSVLKPDSAEARSSLPDGGASWLARLDAGTLPGLGDDEVSGVGVAHNSAFGDVVVASIGGYVCAYSIDAEISTCGTIELLAANGLVAVKPGCEEHLVVGLMPNGVDRLAVNETGDDVSGEARNVAVTSNVYAARLKPVQTTLVGSDDSGDSYSVDLPLGETPRNCP